MVDLILGVPTAAILLSFALGALGVGDGSFEQPQRPRLLGIAILAVPLSLLAFLVAAVVGNWYFSG